MARPGAGDRSDSRPPDETIAETGGGIPDEAVGQGQLPPGELGADAEARAEALRKKGWIEQERQA